MDGFAQNEVSQGNSMLGQMREYNREVLRHNDANRQTFNTQIQTAKNNAKSTKTTDTAKGLAGGFGETGSQVLKTGKQVKDAYDVSSTATDFGKLGSVGQAGRVAGRVFADAPIGKAVAKVGEGVEETAIQGSRLASQTGEALNTVGRAGRDVIQTARTALGSSEGASQVLGRGATAVSETGALSRAGSSGASTIANASEGAETTVSKTEPIGADALKTVGKFGKFAEGAGKLASGVGVIQGGLDAVEDVIGGHIMGKNADSRAGNELGIASGVFDALGFVVPGAGIIGAGLGIASAAEGFIGDKKESAHEVGTVLPGQEKAGMEKGVTGGGATSASTGADTQTQKTPTSSITAGGGAF
jgi:X-X-X-Leu-X-X-Gly heptad repeat protein